MRLQFRFWFEWHTDTALWSANEPAYQQYGVGPIAPEHLPLSPKTCQRIREMAAWHDTALNWHDPAAPLLWRELECQQFHAASQALYKQVVSELGEEYAVSYAQTTYHEDPLLEQYLTDPDGYNCQHNRGRSQRAARHRKRTHR